MAEWYKTQQMVGDKHAAQIKRSYLNRIKATKSATDWEVVENTISQGAIAVYYSIHWIPWDPAKQIVPAYRDMYSRSQKYLNQLKKAEEKFDDSLFTMPNPAAEAWLYEYAGKEITQLSSQDLKMVRAVLAEGQAQKWTYKQTAKVLQANLGLNESQYKAWQNYVDSLKVTESRKVQLGDQYYNKLLKYRAETIALTESHTATNQAWADSVKEATRNGTLSSEKYEMYWLTAPDERRCDQCGGMAGKTTSLESQDFDGLGLPPLHPRCRCTTTVKSK